MSNRFEATFARLKKHNEGAFVPFVNLCDPDQETSLRILETVIAAGADGLELGIPFSDPCADGPVICTSSTRALKNGSTTDKCFELVRSVRGMHPDLPIGLMLYVNLVYAPGIDSFFSRASAAGADAVLIPDVPVSMREACPVWDETARKYGLDLVAIAPPNAGPEMLRKIARLTSGYTYLLSRAGITGTDRASGTPVAEKIQILRDAKAPPTLLGFGVSRPEHVKNALEHGADGVIVGSAIVKIISANLEDTERMLSAVSEYVSEIKAATRS